MKSTTYQAIPLLKRPIDIFFLAFFALNLFFITYIVDLEQIVIANPEPGHFEYPIWPPKWGVDLVHSYAKANDPPLWFRPAWWRMTIWIDALWFGPFYAMAMYCFINAKEWIKYPAFLYTGMIISNVLIICMEELVGEHPTPNKLRVLALNFPWVAVPFAVFCRLAQKHPFTTKKPKEKIKQHHSGEHQN